MAEDQLASDFKPSSELAETLQKLLAVAAAKGGKFLIRAYEPDGVYADGEKPFSGSIVNAGDLAKLDPVVTRFTNALAKVSGAKPGYNIYLAPYLVRENLASGEHGKEADAIGTFALVIDGDTEDGARLPVPPHFKIETSPGHFHYIYILDRLYAAMDCKPVVAALCKVLGCDPGNKLIRPPGTRNYPDAKKRASGRVASRVRIAHDQDGLDDPLSTEPVSLEDLKAAIVAKHPDATFEAQEETAFDWDGRRCRLNEIGDDEVTHALNDPKWIDDPQHRHGGLAAFYRTAFERGHSPEEVVTLVLEHSDTILTSKVFEQTNPEQWLRRDVMRVWKLPVEKKPSAAEAFKDAKLGHDVIDVRSAASAEIGEDDAEAWHTEMNRHFAVAKYASRIVIAQTSGEKLEFLDVEDFHRMFANKFITFTTKNGETKRIPLSKSWFTSRDRREYVNPGVCFKPGAEDRPGMLNLWRGFGVRPKAGDWSLMKAHINDVVCCGNEKHLEYLIKWMAYGVQHPDQPIGVAVALRGAQGAGKGILFRTYGSLFGQHFVHIAQGSQLTGRFNASLGNAVAVFLDEALWAGDRQGEGVLKALITEPTLQLEAKFRDPITVPNHLRIMIASNADWFVPVGSGDRRFLVLDVANTYAGTQHKEYWDALYRETENGGRAAMLHDLLAMDLNDFDVRAVPDTAAKTEQKLHSLRGTRAWLAHVLQEGDMGIRNWEGDGLSIEKHEAYSYYVKFSETRHEWQPELKDVWAKIIHKALGDCLIEAKLWNGGSRRRTLMFRPLAECRAAFQRFIGSSGDAMVWTEI